MSPVMLAVFVRTTSRARWSVRNGAASVPGLASFPFGAT